MQCKCIPSLSPKHGCLHFGNQQAGIWKDFKMPVIRTCNFVGITARTICNSDPQIIRTLAFCPVVILCFLQATFIFEGNYSPCHMGFLLTQYSDILWMNDSSWHLETQVHKSASACGLLFRFHWFIFDL